MLKKYFSVVLCSLTFVTVASAEREPYCPKDYSLACSEADTGEEVIECFKGGEESKTPKCENGATPSCSGDEFYCGRPVPICSDGNSPFCYGEEASCSDGSTAICGKEDKKFKTQCNGNNDAVICLKKNKT